MICPICKRDTPVEFQEKHHLTPKSKKGKETVPVCCDCGDQVHKIISNKELASEYSTIEKLLGHPGIQKWISWVKNKRFGLCMKRKKRK